MDIKTKRMFVRPRADISNTFEVWLDDGDIPQPIAEFMGHLIYQKQKADAENMALRKEMIDSGYLDETRAKNIAKAAEKSGLEALAACEAFPEIATRIMTNWKE